MAAETIADVVHIERRDHALWITLARPQAFNALTPAIIAGLDRALDQVDADAGLRCLVVTGSGRAFCAGADLMAILAASRDASAEAATGGFLRDVGRVFSRLQALRVPTLAAVNGIAVAGGLELLLSCDMALAADTAMLGDGHANFGQIPGGGGTLRLPRRIGAARARYLMLTGLNIDARRAEGWGLVDEVVPAGELVARATALAAVFASHSPLVLARIKQLVAAGLDSSGAVALQAELDLCDRHLSSHDQNEGLAAFSEKRRPVYLGR